MKNKLVLGFIILLVLGFLFYWFQVRSEQKLKECYEGANVSYHKTWDRWDEDGDGKLLRYQADRLNQTLKEEADRCARVWK